MELRIVVSTLTLEYDPIFAPHSASGDAFPSNTRDHFTSVPGDLCLVFKRRESSARSPGSFECPEKAVKRTEETFRNGGC